MNQDVVMVKLLTVMEVVNAGQQHGLVMDFLIALISNMVPIFVVMI